MLQPVKLLIFSLFLLVFKSSPAPLSFDALFAPSPYKTVIDQCMRVRNGVAALHACDLCQPQCVLTAEVTVGRAAMLDAYVKNLLKNIEPVQAHDLLYLHDILQFLHVEAQQLTIQKSEDPLILYIFQTTTTIKQAIDALVR